MTGFLEISRLRDRLDSIIVHADAGNAEPQIAGLASPGGDTIVCGF